MATTKKPKGKTNHMQLLISPLLHVSLSPLARTPHTTLRFLLLSSWMNVGLEHYVAQGFPTTQPLLMCRHTHRHSLIPLIFWHKCMVEVRGHTQTSLRRQWYYSLGVKVMADTLSHHHYRPRCTVVSKRNHIKQTYWRVHITSIDDM